MLNKRGIADTQFHWLFVLLAGGFILFLFAIFINQAIVANQQKQTAQMLQFFDGVFSSTQNVQNLNDVIASIPSIEIESVCTVDGSSKLRFTGQGLDKATTYLPIFSNKLISGNEYAIRTLPHDAPYRVDNPIYLTDSRTLYLIYSSDPDLTVRDEIFDKYTRLIPSHANIITTSDFSRVSASGFRDVVVVSQDEGQILLVDSSGIQYTPKSFKDARVRWVDVITSQNQVNFFIGGILGGDFIFQKPSQWDTNLDPAFDNASYRSDALLLGAIMSQDVESYLCQRAKLDLRTRIIAQQMVGRIKVLTDKINTPNAVFNFAANRCNASYISANSTISIYLARNDAPDQSYLTDLARDNSRLIINSCPNLY